MSSREGAPARPEKGRNGRHGAALLLAALLVSGCASLSGPAAERPSRGAGQLTLYLNGPQRAGEELSFTLSSAAVKARNGELIELLDKPLVLDAASLVNRQVRLGEWSLPPGSYEALRLAAADPSVSRNGRKTGLSLPREHVELPMAMTLDRNGSATVFLRWLADESLGADFSFRPVFTASLQTAEVKSLLLYVTNEASDNVTVIDRRTDDVVGTIRTGDGPGGVAAGVLRERPRVYVANSGSRSVSVIDPATNTVEAVIPIRFGRQPRGIAVARGTGNREWIFTANAGSNSVSIIDGAAFSELGHVAVGSGPVAVVTDPPVEKFATSPFPSADDVALFRRYRETYVTLYTADRISNEVTVIRLDAATGATSEVFSLPVEWSPAALAMDDRRGLLYVANYGSDKVSVINIIELLRGAGKGAVTTIERMGASITALAPDPAMDRLYLLKGDAGSVDVVRTDFRAPAGFTSAAPPLMGAMRVGQSPGAMLLDPEARKLYVVNTGSDSVSVIDTTARREVKTIPVGSRPSGIAVFSEEGLF